MGGNEAFAPLVTTTRRNVVYHNDYKVVKQIGKGSTCKVYLAKKDSAKFALKVFSSQLRRRTDLRFEKRKSGTQIVRAMTSKEKVHAEGQITMKLDHKNVVKTFEILENQQNMILVLEYCAGSELMRWDGEKHRFVASKSAAKVYKTERNGTIAEISLKMIAKSLINALKYLKRSRVSHRDLKPTNIMVFPRDKDVKISDFGLSKQFPADEACALDSGQSGTSFFLPPECFLEETYDPFKRDVWSFGVALYVAFYGTPPFFAETTEKITEKIVSEPTPFGPKEASADFKSFLSKLLKKDPKERPDVDDLEKERWLKS